jgi:gliding motility-associated lipoprotein GldH
MKFIKIIFFTALIGFSISSCDPNMVYDQYHSTENENWSWPEVRKFEVDMQDSTGLFNLFINIRHTKEYPKSNLYVFIKIEAPNGSVLKDTVDIQLANDSGKWFGHGFGNILMHRLKYREAVKFPQKGLYTISLEQAMRLEEVPVTDVGIRIEKFKSFK